MVIFIPQSFEPFLHINKAKHHVIHMNGESPASRGGDDCCGYTSLVQCIAIAPSSHLLCLVLLIAQHLVGKIPCSRDRVHRQWTDRVPF
jgi:hypothetical protein